MHYVISVLNMMSTFPAVMTAVNRKKKTRCEEESADKEEDRKSDDIEVESAKRKAAKVKIKPLCETRCVERHTGFQDFEDL